jgi:hypothetical protein
LVYQYAYPRCLLRKTKHAQLRWAKVGSRRLIAPMSQKVASQCNVKISGLEQIFAPTPFFENLVWVTVFWENSRIWSMAALLSEPIRLKWPSELRQALFKDALSPAILAVSVSRL